MPPMSKHFQVKIWIWRIWIFFCWNRNWSCFSFSSQNSVKPWIGQLKLIITYFRIIHIRHSIHLAQFTHGVAAIHLIILTHFTGFIRWTILNTNGFFCVVSSLSSISNSCKFKCKNWKERHHFPAHKSCCTGVCHSNKIAIVRLGCDSF